MEEVEVGNESDLRTGFDVEGRVRRCGKDIISNINASSIVRQLHERTCCLSNCIVVNLCETTIRTDSIQQNTLLRLSVDQIVDDSVKSVCRNRLYRGLIRIDLITADSRIANALDQDADVRIAMDSVGRERARKQVCSGCVVVDDHRRCGTT